MKLEKIQKKHEQEKQQALEELSKLRVSLQERETKLTKDFNAKFESLKQNAEGMNAKFQEKILQFETANQNLRKALQESTSSSSYSIDELKKKYDSEIRETVKTANEKYQNMLIEQLSMQESTKKDYEIRIAQLMKELNDKYSTDLNKELGQLRATLNAEKQELILNNRHELEQKLLDQKSEFSQKMDALMKDLKHRSLQLEELRQSSSDKILQLENELQVLKKMSLDEKGGSELQLSLLKAENDKRQELIASLTSTIKTRDEEMASMKLLLDEKNRKLISMEEDFLALNQKYARNLKELENLKFQLSQEKQSVDGELRKQILQNEDANKQIAALKDSLNKLQSESEMLTKSSKEIQSKLQEDIELLKSQKILLEKKLQEMNASNANSTSQQLNEINILKQKMRDIEENHENEKNQLLKANLMQLQSLTSRYEEEMTVLHQSQKVELNQHQKREESLLKDIQRQQEMYEAKLKNMEADSSSKIQQLSQSTEEEKMQLNNKILSLQEENTKLANSHESEKLIMKNDYNKLENKYKAVMKDLETKKYEMERHESITTSLKQQIEQLREELKVSQKQYANSLNTSIVKLESEWSQKFQSEIDRLNAEKMEEINDLMKKFELEKSFILKQSELEINEIKLLLQKEVNNFENDRRQQEIQYESLQIALKQEKSARLQEVQDLQTQFQKKLQHQEETHQSALNISKKDLQIQHEQTILNLKENHRSELSVKDEQFHQQQLKHKQDLADLRTSLTDEKYFEVKKSHDDCEKLMIEKYEKILTALNEKFEKEKAVLLGDITTRTQMYEEVKQQKATAEQTHLQEINRYERTLQDERNERQRREEKFVIEKDSMQREHQLGIRKEKEEYERKIVGILSRHEEDIKLLQDETQQTRQNYEDKIRQILKEYAILQDKYQNRESRPEDILRIKSLEEEIIEKTDLVNKIKEEMNYFKREMLNREDNYNQKFNRQPNVGVMQVIKPKEVVEPPTFGRGKATTMHVINPNGGNLSMPGVGNMNVSSGGPPGSSKVSKSTK